MAASSLTGPPRPPQLPPQPPGWPPDPWVQLQGWDGEGPSPPQCFQPCGLGATQCHHYFDLPSRGADATLSCTQLQDFGCNCTGTCVARL